MSYPKYLYHAEKGAVLVKDEKEEKALGAGFEDSPAKLKKASKKEEKPEEKPKAKKGRPAKKKD